jgi:AraC-like DNA-binding protein
MAQNISHFFAVSPLRSRRLLIRGLGIAEASGPRVVNRPRGSGDYLLSYFHDPVWLAGGELPRPHPAGTLMIFSPGRWQYFGNRQAPFRHSYLHIDGEIFRYLIREHDLAVDEPVALLSGQMIDRALEDIDDELTGQSRPDLMIVRNLLDTMGRQIARAVPGSTDRQTPQTLLAIRRQIELDYHKKLPLPALAAQAGLSVSHFTEQFRRHFGLPPHEYLLRQRLQRGAHLLRDRSLTVAAAARAVGYADVKAFARLFKKQFSLSPSALRAQDPKGGESAPAVGEP